MRGIMRVLEQSSQLFKFYNRTRAYLFQNTEQCLFFKTRKTLIYTIFCFSRKQNKVIFYLHKVHNTEQRPPHNTLNLNFYVDPP